MQEELDVIYVNCNNNKDNNNNNNYAFSFLPHNNAQRFSFTLPVAVIKFNSKIEAKNLIN